MLETKTVELSGWGGYPRVAARVSEPTDLALFDISGDGSMIMRGQGRSYGDAAISKSGIVVLSERFNSVGQVDERGWLVAEAGATLDDILRLVVPLKWFPAVVPGTRFVSLGGCLAADVHGKNHHRVGSFAQHVGEFELLGADRKRITCSAHKNGDIFWATAGGMGLTGIITELTMKLIPVESPFMVVRHHQLSDLEASMQSLTDPQLDDEYSVVWLDCLAKGSKLGRGVLIGGHHAKDNELQELEPAGPATKYDLRFELPSWLLNRKLVASFNSIYYRYQSSRTNAFIQHYDDFFFPLDRIGNWSRLYGRRGFIQYQCVLPLSGSDRGIRLLLEELSASRVSSFLAVLKKFGPPSPGLLSFPFAGFTLSLDFPFTDGLLTFLERLDQVVVRLGGRVYLAKDARLKPETFKLMYPRLDELLTIKARLDPNNNFQSDLSRRLQIQPAPVRA